MVTRFLTIAFFLWFGLAQFVALPVEGVVLGLLALGVGIAMIANA